MSRLGDITRALLGVSTYSPPADAGYGPALDDDMVEKIRKALGGQLSPLPTTKLRWYLADLETAQHAADAGDISSAARLYRAMRRDGTLSGLLKTRTAGLVRLPKKFYGRAEINAALQAKNGTRSVFDDMFPPSELGLLAADGIVLGVGVAELVPVDGRDFPVMVRHDPEWLRYRWSENRWYFQSIAGPIPITPGDGRWILHTPGGRISPWNHAMWPALGRAYINKEHALLHRSNFGAKLANPARVAQAPGGATEAQRKGFLRQLMAWGVNSVFELPPGWEAKLLESNGRGYEVFQSEIDTSEREYMISIAGQTVTVDGGTGFANADIHKTIASDLIDETGETLGHTINTQGIPLFIVMGWGEGALEDGSCVEWDTTPPKNLQTEAQSLSTTAGAITALGEALTPYGRKLDIDQITTRFGVPVAGDVDGDGKPDDIEDELALPAEEPANDQEAAA